MNSPLSLDAHTFSTAELRVEVPRPVARNLGLARPAASFGSATPGKKKGLSNGVGLIVTVVVHVVALALLLSNHVQTVAPPQPIMAKVISDAAPRRTEALKPIEPVMEKTRLETPPPELFIASDAPAPVAQIVTRATLKEEPARQVVDSQPRFDADYLDNPAPVYPKLSKARREEGKVLLLVHVLPDGLPDEIKIKRSSGSERLDQSALTTVQRWKFVPATSGGNPVAAWVIVPLEFSLSG